MVAKIERNIKYFEIVTNIFMTILFVIGTRELLRYFNVKPSREQISFRVFKTSSDISLSLLSSILEIGTDTLKAPAMFLNSPANMHRHTLHQARFPRYLWHNPVTNYL